MMLFTSSRHSATRAHRRSVCESMAQKCIFSPASPPFAVISAAHAGSRVSGSSHVACAGAR